MANVVPSPTGTDFGPLGPSAGSACGGSGTHITSPWFDGSWEVTQGWGPTCVSLEPEGHGYINWHAGVDIGLDCGTVIHVPADFAYQATVVQFNNPGGYGTGLIVKVSQQVTGAGRGFTVKPVVDIYLGHLRQYLTANGAAVNPGQPIAVSNNTGNSTGCHLHYEVRPPGGAYGTDVDPAVWIQSGGPASVAPNNISTPGQNPFDPFTQAEQWLEWQLTHDITAPLQQVGNELLGLAQAGLGSAIMLGGIVALGAGIKGLNAGQLGAAARRTLTERRPEPVMRQPTPQQPAPSQPYATRAPMSPEAESAVSEARAGRGRRLSPQVSDELRRRGTPPAGQQAAGVRQTRLRPSLQRGGSRR